MHVSTNGAGYGRGDGHGPEKATNGIIKPPGTPTSDQKGGDDPDKPQEVIVMGKYRMNLRQEDWMGEGTFSICRKGTSIETGEKVAIKVYKTTLKNKPIPMDTLMMKFTRQINVLQELQKPFDAKPTNPRLWSQQLAETKPSKLFMQLLDFSRDARGQPGPDPTDNMLYIVTELAQYSLKDYLALRRDQKRPLAPEAIENISRAILLVMGGLHAKGLVHIDMKPENLMMFNGRLKLIDVDGCVKIGSKVSIQDPSISFSPCYCAPEWAKFVIGEMPITVDAALDCWSIGMTLCELVTLDAVLKPMYASFLRNGHSHREAAFCFMDWLSSCTKAPIKTNEQYDPRFLDMLVNGLLIPDPVKRKTCAEALLCPFIAGGGAEQADPSHNLVADGAVKRRHGLRMEDLSSEAPAFKSVLWKLNSDGNAADAAHWLKRDMWITTNGALSYWSMKENKRLILIGGDKLAGAKIEKFTGGTMPFAFEVKFASDDKNEEEVSFHFAAESQAQYDLWFQYLTSASDLDKIVSGFRLGEEMAEEQKKYRKVKNRRMSVGEDDGGDFAPVFKAKLWKLKAEGNKQNPDDWFEREMWVARNGSLVYWSKKEERDLVYYTAEDMERATFQTGTAEESCKPFPFQVELAPLPDQCEVFVTGDFAAETEEMRKLWLAALEKGKQDVRR